MSEERLPKAKLLTCRWVGWPKKYGPHKAFWWLYVRCANYAIFYLGPLCFTARRPWLPAAAYWEGWNQCWMKMAFARTEENETEARAALKEGEGNG